MPPVTTKQTPPPPKVNGRGKAGGILSRAVPVAEMEESPIHMLLYGRNRVGKTTLACQFPKPLLLISVEPSLTGGAASVRNVPGVKVLRWGVDLYSSGDVEKLGHELQGDTIFKTVVLDSGTSLDEIVLAEICGWDRPAELIAFGPYKPGAKVTMDQYTERSERMRKILRKYLDLPHHVVINANEKDHNPPEGRKAAMVRSLATESFFAASLGGGTVKWLQDGCDYVCQLFIDKEVREEKQVTTVNKETTEEVVLVETGRLVRKLRTQYHPNFAAGVRSPNPKGVPEFIEEPTWEKIQQLAGLTQKGGR